MSQDFPVYGLTGATALADALLINSTLQYINLCFNPISDSTPNALEALLREHGRPGKLRF